MNVQSMFKSLSKENVQLFYNLNTAKLQFFSLPSWLWANLSTSSRHLSMASIKLVFYCVKLCRIDHVFDIQVFVNLRNKHLKII